MTKISPSEFGKQVGQFVKQAASPGAVGKAFGLPATGRQPGSLFSVAKPPAAAAPAPKPAMPAAKPPAMGGIMASKPKMIGGHGSGATILPLGAPPQAGAPNPPGSISGAPLPPGGSGVAGTEFLENRRGKTISPALLNSAYQLRGGAPGVGGYAAAPAAALKPSGPQTAASGPAVMPQKPSQPWPTSLDQSYSSGYNPAKSLRSNPSPAGVSAAQTMGMKASPAAGFGSGPGIAGDAGVMRSSLPGDAAISDAEMDSRSPIYNDAFRKIDSQRQSFDRILNRQPENPYSNEPEIGEDPFVD